MMTLDTPPRGRRPACYSADLEFVVDTLGKPEARTARVVRQNDQGFAESLLASIPSWTYDPGVRGGVRVRQIVTTHQSMGVVVATVVVAAGQPRPLGPPAVRPPTC